MSSQSIIIDWKKSNRIIELVVFFPERYFHSLLILLKSWECRPVSWWDSPCLKIGFLCLQNWISLSSKLDFFVFKFGFLCLQIWISLSSKLDFFVFKLGFLCLQIWISLSSNLDFFLMRLDWKLCFRNPYLSYFLYNVTCEQRHCYGFNPHSTGSGHWQSWQQLVQRGGGATHH